MNPTDIATTLCSDNASLLRTIVQWAFNAISVIGAGAIASNSKTLQNVPYLGPILNFVGANWASWLRQAAANAAVKKSPT